MGLDADALLADARAFVAAFGESVVYIKTSGVRRTIQAVVERQPPAAIPESPVGVLGYALPVHVVNSATDGISSIELDSGGDQIELALRVGETAQARPVRKPLDSDPGMMILEVG